MVQRRGVAGLLAQIVERDLPGKPVEAGKAQVRIGTDAAHGATDDLCGVGMVAGAGRMATARM